MRFFRSLEVKHGVDDPSYEPPDPTPAYPGAESSSDADGGAAHGAPSVALWRRIARVVVFILLVANAWPLFLNGETSVWETPATKIEQGILLTLIAMAVVGSIKWGIRRLRHAPTSWWQATFTIPVMLITFVVGAFTHVGREQEAVERATQSAAEQSHTSVGAVRTEQDAYVGWMQAFLGALPTRVKGARAARHVEVIEAGSHPGLTGLQQAFGEGYAAAQAWSRAVNALPADDTHLVPINEELARSASREVAGWRDYVVGFKTGDFKLAERGDAARKSSLLIMRRAVQADEALYHQLGGARTFKGRIDYERLAEITAEERRAAGVK
jgi:hypothetical protein